MKRTSLYRYGKQSLTRAAAGFAAALMAVSLPAGIENTVSADVIDSVIQYAPDTNDKETGIYVEGFNGISISCIAKSMLDTPYVFAGSSEKGIDASGLALYCYQQIGITLPHGCDSICKNIGFEVDRKNLLPGDLVCYDYGTCCGHIGIYVGLGKVIHASTTFKKVVMEDIDMMPIRSIKRIIKNPLEGFDKPAGWKQMSGKWYYFNKNGNMDKGWKKDAGKWYYLDSKGAMVTGWVKVNDVWYYMDTDGHMVTGWKQVDGKWYYLEESGAMATGWKEQGGKWYYLNSDGSMATGWKYIDAKWYFFEESGAMSTGWKQLGGILYFFGNNGDMALGWKNVDGKWYYFGLSGNMAKGWKLIGLNWYYFDETGKMTTGLLDFNGIKYYFGKDGALVEG